MTGRNDTLWLDAPSNFTPEQAATLRAWARDFEHEIQKTVSDAASAAHARGIDFRMGVQTVVAVLRHRAGVIDAFLAQIEKMLAATPANETRQ